jgi:hypothetical protein
MTIVRDSFYINGEWVKASSKETLEVTSSGTGEHYATIPGHGRRGQFGSRGSSCGLHGVVEHEPQRTR